MAKAMKMQDRKNYFDRVKKGTNGNAEGREISEMSKILNIKHDLKKGYFVSPAKIKMLEEFEKNKIVDRL